MINCELIELSGSVYLNVWEPEMQKRKLSIGELRKVVLELKFVEKKISLLKNLRPYVKGWAIWIYHTKESHKKMIEKLGAKKLIDTQDRTWFVKGVV